MAYLEIGIDSLLYHKSEAYMRVGQIERCSVCNGRLLRTRGLVASEHPTLNGVKLLRKEVCLICYDALWAVAHKSINSGVLKGAVYI